MRTLRLLCVAVLLALPSVAQQAGGPNVFHERKEIDTGIISTSGTSIIFPDTIGTYHNQFEVIFTGAPATATINVYGRMRGGTLSASLGTSSATTSAIIPVSGPYDGYQVTASWTGGTSPHATINRTGIGN